jgi:membrane associated rhomboid family serine protease
MIPIREAIRSKNFPAVSILIISLNVIVFLWELLQGPDLRDVFYEGSS